MAAVEEAQDASILLYESSDHFAAFLNPAAIYTGTYTFLKESLKKRHRRKLVKRSGISQHPRRDKILLNGYNGNWMTSWFRSGLNRKSSHPSGELSQSRGDVTQKAQYENSGRSFNSQRSTEDLFLRSTGEIHDGQTDDFVFLSDDVRCNDEGGSDMTPDFFDTHMAIANVFWKSTLNRSSFRVGDPLLGFDSLWPCADVITTTLMECMSVTSLRMCVADLALMSLRCGPLRVLRTILELGLMDVHQEFEGGLSMLHVGCISQNFDACLYLCTLGANRKQRDSQGRKPYHVCMSDQIRKLLPSPQHKRETASSQTQKGQENSREFTIRQSHRIFSLLEDEDQLDEALFLLQEEGCKVNEIMNNTGDHVIHVLVRKGLSHLSTLINLTQLRSVNVNKFNSSGMSPLMVAADEGNDAICDVLICILGADPNKQNPISKHTALHYAAKGDHLDTVCLLLRRGVDVNAETSESMRADDLARVSGHSDCSDVINVSRETRRRHLSLIARQGNLDGENLYDSDLVMVDQLGDTLLMTAARHNRLDNIDVLLARKKKVIDAQNIQSGKTSLSIAASLGLTEVVDVLIGAGANPRIPDMASYTALHHAVISGHETTTEALLEQAACWHDLQKAVKMSPSKVISRLLYEARNRRQEMVVSPALLEGAITGNVDLLFDTLEEGDDVNPLSGQGNWPAYLSAAGGHLVVLDFLAKNGGNIWAQHEVTFNTALHVAASNGHDEVVAFLIKHYGYAGEKAAKKIINQKNGEGYTALQLAAENGYTRTVRLLLDQGASTSVLDKAGQLYNCPQYQGIQMVIQEARARHIDMIISAIRHPNNPVYKLKQVFERSTDHNLRTSNGNSPILIACHHGNIEVVKYLLKTADDLRNKEILERNAKTGDTVLHYTVVGGDHVAVVRLLVSIDQSLINAINRKGHTPLHTACALGRRQTVEKLTGMPGVDVNVLDCNQKRPDDLTNNTVLRHMIASVRRRQGSQQLSGNQPQRSPQSFHGESSTIDFEELNRKFLQVKLQQQAQKQTHLLMS